MLANGEMIIDRDRPILVTGAAGFIGRRVVERLLKRGFSNVRCIVRPTSDCKQLHAVIEESGKATQVQWVRGDLLSRKDCARAVERAAVIYHLAAGRGEKSFSEAFMHSVVTTRNLLEAAAGSPDLKRFVTISSFSVYNNDGKRSSRVLDESCPVEDRPELRGDAYTFAKVKQDEMVIDYGKRSGVPYVIVRPGYVYGPGNEGITGRVGLGTFGLFLHMGGGNTIPFTYVDNCAEAIVLAGLKPGIDGEAFNVVDDNLPSSREFLREYKKNVKRFRSVYLPHWVSYLLCWTWECYSRWSEGQLPPVFNRKVWYAYWKRTTYSNEKLKSRLGWSPQVSSADALRTYFECCRVKRKYA